MLDIARGQLLHRSAHRLAEIIRSGLNRWWRSAAGARKGEGGALFSGGLEGSYFFSHMNSHMGSPLGIALVRTHLYCGLMASAMPSHMGWKQ
jgi:hypothetical protein